MIQNLPWIDVTDCHCDPCGVVVAYYLVTVSWPLCSWNLLVIYNPLQLVVYVVGYPYQLPLWAPLDDVCASSFCACEIISLP